jgi:DNA-binding transcriptional LysR family regulator
MVDRELLARLTTGGLWRFGSLVGPPDVKDESGLGKERNGMTTTWRASIGQVPELRRLRYFLAVAGEQNFTRAAELLHVAQPALSRQVRQLERELGVELLHRTTHTFELTEAGRFLYERGPVLLDAADELWRLTTAYGTGERGTVSLGYGVSASYETAPELLRGLTDRLPDIQVTTQVLPTGQILAGVHDGTIDIGVVRCPPVDAGLETRLLRLEPQGIELRRDDPRAAGERICLDEIADMPFLMHARDANPGHYDAVLGVFRDRGVEPDVMHRKVTLDLALTPLVAGEAVALAGESARLGLPGDLVWLPLDPPTAFETRLLARAGGTNPAAERLLAAAEEVADELGWRGDAAGR